MVHLQLWKAVQAEKGKCAIFSSVIRIVLMPSMTGALYNFYILSLKLLAKEAHAILAWLQYFVGNVVRKQVHVVPLGRFAGLF